MSRSGLRLQECCNKRGRGALTGFLRRRTFSHAISRIVASDGFGDHLRICCLSCEIQLKFKNARVQSEEEGC